jgi:c-di-GMP-binding flagellar brake protein YcgR
MASTHPAERRRHLRIALPFPATVEGTNEEGEPFECGTVTDDLSAGGVYLRVAERVREGAEVSVTARLSVSAARGMVVRLRGRVLRAEEKPGGACVLAVRVEESSIL